MALVWKANFFFSLEVDFEDFIWSWMSKIFEVLDLAEEAMVLL